MTSALAATVTALVASCVALALAPAALANGSPVCGDSLSSSVVLAADIDCTGYSGSAALTVVADGITVDLNGHTIFGTTDVNSAINVTGRTGVTVRGGTIYGATQPPTSNGPYGVFVWESTTIRLENLVVVDTGSDVDDTGWGVWIGDSAKVRVNNVQVARSLWNGGNIVRSTDVVVSKSSFSDNANDGMLVSNSIKVQINGSRFDGNANGDGLQIDQSDQVTVANTSGSKNSEAGIESNGTSRLRLDRITATANSGTGFAGYDVRAQITNSNFSYNERFGAYLVVSSFQISNSTLVRNGSDGLFANMPVTFVIKKVTSSLNREDGIDVNGNVSGPYKVEYTVCNTNLGDGFSIEGFVTAKGNVAKGNIGSNATP